MFPGEDAIVQVMKHHSNNFYICKIIKTHLPYHVGHNCLGYFKGREGWFCNETFFIKKISKSEILLEML